MQRFNIEHDEGTIVVREFRYEGDDGIYAATLWVGDENAGEEADAMLNSTQVTELIAALQAVITT